MRCVEAEPEGADAPMFCGAVQQDLFRYRGAAAAGSDEEPCLAWRPAAGSEGDVQDYFRIRDAVICLHTAARIHGLHIGSPRPLWVGAPLRVHVPKRDPAELRVIRWSNRQAFEVGVRAIRLPAGTVRCTTPERTIVDLVRYGRHAGEGAVGAACLWSYLASGGRGEAVSTLADTLRISRPARVILDTLLVGMGARP